jgi:hypothetical protein
MNTSTLLSNQTNLFLLGQPDLGSGVSQRDGNKVTYKKLVFNLLLHNVHSQTTFDARAYNPIEVECGFVWDKQPNHTDPGDTTTWAKDSDIWKTSSSIPNINRFLSLENSDRFQIIWKKLYVVDGAKTNLVYPPSTPANPTQGMYYRKIIRGVLNLKNAEAIFQSIAPTRAIASGSTLYFYVRNSLNADGNPATQSSYCFFDGAFRTRFYG